MVFGKKATGKGFGPAAQKAFLAHLAQTANVVWRGRFLGVRNIISDPRDPARMVLTCEEAR